MAEMGAIPNDSGVCFARPWLRTSHGESPSFDSSSSTIPKAKSARPPTRASQRTTIPPRTAGGMPCTRGLTGAPPQRVAQPCGA